MKEKMEPRQFFECLPWFFDATPTLCTCSLNWTQFLRSNRHRVDASSYKRGRQWGWVLSALLVPSVWKPQISHICLHLHTHANIDLCKLTVCGVAPFCRDVQERSLLLPEEWSCMHPGNVWPWSGWLYPVQSTVQCHGTPLSPKVWESST